jgi:hypothetical protein
VAVALLVLPALTGCRLYNWGATSVGQTTATLEASGRTDGDTAYYHFEYARSTSAFGTAAALATPERGPIGPHTPSDGRLVPIREGVSGLAAGRIYWTRVCGRVSGMTTSICTGAEKFFTLPSDAQDHLTGWGTDGSTWDISVSASSGPQGQEPEGTLYLVPQKGEYFDSITVTCFRVQGDTATVGATGDWVRDYYSQEPPVPGHALLTVVRDTSAPYGNVAYVNEAGAGGDPPDCADGGTTTPFFPHALQNDFTLVDVP